MTHLLALTSRLPHDMAFDHVTVAMKQQDHLPDHLPSVLLSMMKVGPYILIVRQSSEIPAALSMALSASYGHDIGP